MRNRKRYGSHVCLVRHAYGSTLRSDKGTSDPLQNRQTCWQPPSHTRGTTTASPAINFPRRFNVHRRVQSQTVETVHPLHL